jgi:hypothetical protein
MTSVPRPDEVPDGSPFGNLKDDHSVDRFSDEDAKSVQEGVPDGSPFNNLEDDHSVDGFSNEDAESFQEGVPDGSPFKLTTSRTTTVWTDSQTKMPNPSRMTRDHHTLWLGKMRSLRRKSRKKKLSDENLQADKTNHSTRESCEPPRLRHLLVSIQ